MRTRICHFCLKEIHEEAVICRYCRCAQPPGEPPAEKRSAGWLTAITLAGIIVGGAAFLAAEFLRERKNWLSEPPGRPRSQSRPD